MGCGPFIKRLNSQAIHQSICSTLSLDPGGPEAPPREEYRTLRLKARKRTAVHGRGVPSGEAVRLWVRQDHWGKVLQKICCRHARLSW